MACKNRSKVYLGFEDEFITEKHRSLVNFATNKLGGIPDSHNDTPLVSPVCKLCGLNQILALQLYVPLENSKYHRTLYIFTCINPNCWNQNESWTCLRIQSSEEKTINERTATQTEIPSTTSWLSSADDWGDEGNDNASEKNGNVLKNEPSKKLNLFMKSTDLDDELREDLSNLCVNDPNANSPASIESPGSGGAVGRLDSPQASAEIEGEESEVVCIDTPMQPQCNLMELLHGVTPHPFQHSDVNSSSNLAFAEAFIGVDEEDLCVDISQHVRDLFLEYQRCNPDNQVDTNAKSNETNAIDEKYEKNIPIHGDESFHNFISRIQQNPGQLLRALQILWS
ncbi:programmed cell death protein 2-like isoform X2 [Chelonus insularis]|uniref:programmed cell death protein 2-like isoform X2 n=1 Tax=Chelonus insularis TaxID=460826 RepID=UPI00158D260F|nr:programmed cell death protein 2-like isoform X2 [Chelonus insularis]